MKKLSKETAFNLKTGFGTLISNQSCIEAGKSLPWWIAIILGLIATFIPVIPVMVNISKTNGDSFLGVGSTYNYSVDRNATIATKLMKENGVELSVGEDHYLTYYLNDVEQKDLTEPAELASYVNPVTNQYDVKAYWLAPNEAENKTVTDYYNQIVGTKYKLGTTTLKAESDEDSACYVPSYLFFYKEGNALFLAKSNTVSAANKFTGDYINVPAGKLVERLLTVQGVEEPTSVAELTPAYIEGVYKNYQAFYNQSYLDIKTKSLIYSTFIYWGIYLGLTIFLGFLIFLLTRGKRNFNNYLKWYECLCIAAWASFTPGLLAMILGFLMTNYAIMFFILLMGVRTMWLSMKQLSPNYQQAQ